MQFSRAFAATVLFAMCTGLNAFPCYLTLVKDNCWTDYTVNLQVFDAQSDKSVVTVAIPRGKSWQRQQFECQADQKLSAKASFSPTIWANDEGKTYSMINYIFLPENILPNQSAWEIPICFPSAFSSVPYPAKATGRCTCDFKSIPLIPPKKA